MLAIRAEVAITKFLWGLAVSVVAAMELNGEVSTSEHFTAVLKLPPVDSPEKAVRAAIAAQVKHLCEQKQRLLKASKNLVRSFQKNPPPKLRGVAAPSIKCREATSEKAQTEWFPKGTAPPFAEKRANGTPSDLGEEFANFKVTHYPWSCSWS